MTFEKRRSALQFAGLNTGALQGMLTAEQRLRLDHVIQCWDFYDGYHWEDIPNRESSQLTINYCRAFVDKFVAFELGKSFTFSTSAELEDKKVTSDGKKTLFRYLESVWEDNEQYALAISIGQMKSVTGEAWVQVRFSTLNEMDDPFNEYEEMNGRVELLLMPTGIVFPEYDPKNKDKLIKLSIIYSYQVTEPRSSFLGITAGTEIRTYTFRQEWTKDNVSTWDRNQEPVVVPNKYGVIPFALFKNLPIANTGGGRSDIDDVIPMNLEYDMKQSNVSEILDYHASPITLVYGAKIGNLEKGANRVWGGLAKDAKVENLELKGDLGASNSYAQSLKLAMCEVAAIPETVLGGAQSISNTSGVALQYLNLPLIEKTRIKKIFTETGFEYLNKLIILVSLLEGLITKPDDVSNRDFYHTEVDIPDTLPKDDLIELQILQAEMRMGIEDREGAMKRLGKENIQATLSRVEADMKAHPEMYGQMPNQPELNSGMTNGQTPVEQVRKEITGANGVQKTTI